MKTDLNAEKEVNLHVLPDPHLTAGQKRLTPRDPGQVTPENFTRNVPMEHRGQCELQQSVSDSSTNIPCLDRFHFGVGKTEPRTGVSCDLASAEGSQ